MRFTIIGLGRFGSRLAAQLADKGQEVIGIDRDPRIIEEMRDRVTLAISLDATDEQALIMQGIDKVDVAVVGIGTDFEAIALTTVVLKEIGVPHVVARAVSPTSARILKSIGADDVVNPEDEAADRWSHRLVAPKFMRQFELDQGFSLVEIPTPRKWVGQSLAKLNLRVTEGLHVVAVRRRKDQDDPQSPISFQIPQPGEPLRAEEVLVVLGQDEDVARLPR
ncbi:TrkA family potassium uptake protein [Phycisphaerales bacterium AB-hyl4]|uniref:TrkA family potassium uptake protein n=1 Tax=Natronomicrosphaera hydrolytica TaxID=3242702 RepID=A0ABV4U949_9BACT